MELPLSVGVSADVGQIMRLCIFSFFLVLASVGCSKRPVTSPNVLILAVENLNAEDALCAEDLRPGVTSDSGLDQLCDEAVTLGSVRSVSRSALPSLASFLFGLPVQQMRLNGNHGYVPAEFESFPEKAYAKGWATGFFGSSPLFMRRSGLAQGFEVFEESAAVENLRWGRRADQITQSFLRWQNEQGKTPFYAVLTFSDLNFPWVKTTNLVGQERPHSIEGQLGAVSEAWLVLFRALNERKAWDNTWVIVTGLGGRGEPGKRNRVAGFLKPTLGAGSEEFKERNMSLTEFSNLFHQTLFHLPAHTLPSEPANTAPTIEPIANWPGGASWITPAASESRRRVFYNKIGSHPELAPWLLLELLEQNKSQEFINLAHSTGPLDAQPFWERVLLKKRTQILQDPCLRMVDLRILEGGGSKTCNSATLLGLQDWMRDSALGSEESHLREARQKTLRALHELRSIRRIQMINFALGHVYPFQMTKGFEILQTEMALRLPDQQGIRNWLDQAEPSLIEKQE